MKKNRKLLWLFLVFNAIAKFGSAGSDNLMSGKYERIYNSIVKNTKTEKSNKKNYQIIEDVLKQKNKELKDLYIQGDYIIKPEYLEWQVFLSGFYEEHGKGVDNSSANARYHSKISGYYDADGNFMATSGGVNGLAGKPYNPLQKVKNIDFGVSIPLKGMTREALNLNLSPVAEISVNPAVLTVTPPTGVAVPQIDPVIFQPVSPSIPVVETPNPVSISLTFPGSGNGDEQWIKQNGSVAPVAQQVLKGGAGGGYLDVVSNSAVRSQDFDLSIQNTYATGLEETTHDGTNNGLQNINWKSQTSSHAVMKLVGSHTIDIENMTMNFIGTKDKSEAYLMLFHTDAHNFDTEDSVWALGSDTKINMHGEKIILYGVQSHSSYATGSGMINNGTVTTSADTAAVTNRGESYSGLNPHQRIIFTTINADSSINSYNRYFYFTNSDTGSIALKGTGDILENYATPGTDIGGTVFTNNGTISMNGAQNYGILLNAKVYYNGSDYTDRYDTYNTGHMNYGDSKILLNKALDMNGDESVGIQILNPHFNFQNSVIKLNIGNSANQSDSTGNLSVYDAGYVDKTMGIFVNYNASAYSLTFDDYDINLGKYSKDGIGIIVKSGEVNLANNSKTSSIVSDGGIGNILLVSDGSSSAIKIAGNTTLEAKNGNKQTGVLADNNSSVSIGSNLTMNGDASIAYIVNNGASVINTGTTSLTGGVYNDGTKNNGSVGVAVIGNGSSFTSAGSVNIDVSGQESTGLFAENGTVNINGGSIKTSDKAFNLYAKGTTGLITLENMTTETGQGSLLFYSENNGSFNLTNINSVIKGGTDSVNRGTAFYYTGTGTLPSLTTTGLSNYFNTVFNGTAGNLTLEMESGSRLFIVDNVSINLSTTSTPLGSIAGGPAVNGSDYKTYMMYKSSLDIDQGINLDNANDAYKLLEISTSSIKNSGQNITGTGSGQVAMAQENGRDTGGAALARSTVSLINDAGNITLNGASSVGLYSSFGELKNINSGIISANGAGSVGIYGANGSVIENQSGSAINISDSGVGIYAEGYKQGTAQNFGDGKINVTNSGTITANTSTGATGIYINNNSTGNQADALLNLTNGVINLEASENAAGVLAMNGTVTDSGSTITVGKNGIALYAKDSKVTLSGTTINLLGDNSLGFYLDGNTDFTGAGTINISGQNVVLFNMNTSGTVSNNFTVGDVTDGSSYTLGNIINGAFSYTGTTSLASYGTLISGENSAVYLNGSNVTSAAGATNVAAIALNGQYAGTLPSGMTAGIDGENNGIVTVGDSSAGLYGKNGSRLSNAGTITVGTGSVGLMTSGSGSVVLNSGTVSIGTGSQGIYLKDGLSVNNTGSITSNAAGTAGIYTDSNVSPVTLTNGGTIDLGGDKSIGIYTVGTNTAFVSNASGALIKVGDSSDISSPAIGIYSATAGSTVANSGMITSGVNSIGIYSNNGTVNNNGTLNIGDTGTGIYSLNGIINLNTGTAVNMGTNGAAAVYGVNSSVTNSAGLNIGNSNYGFILQGGSFVNSAGISSSTGNDSVYMYGTGAVNVVNNGDVIMTGSDNVAFYLDKDSAGGVGGAAVVNNGTISGTAGENNVGIYNYGGTVDNHGTISVGDSKIVFISGTTDVDVHNSKYSVGIYGENASIVNHATASITAGYGGYGIAAKGGTASNFGTITTNGDYSTGMFTDGGVITNEAGGTITVTGNSTIGMAGKGSGSQIINHGTINITGDNATGMYALPGTVITNTGEINITGNGQALVSSEAGNSAHNVESGTASVNGSVSNTIQGTGNSYALPVLINAGLIKTSGVMALEGVQVMIKPDISTKQASGDPDYDFVLTGTSLAAEKITTSRPIVILPGFADGTIANVYKLEGLIQASAGKYEFTSGSVLWEATPEATATGSDVYMERKAFTEFTDGLWFEDFGRALEENYLSASGKGIDIYNKTAYIPDEKILREVMASLAGDVYANINQREKDIAEVLENSLHILQDSTNNTKENVKVNVIAGKGRNGEETDGVVGYDYTTAGVLALREVERTYRHTFGYSLGYLHTGFEFNDGNSSEEWVDTIQLGVHNKYNADSWILRNDLTGRMSFHNIDRNIDWPSPLERSEMNGIYGTYSITSDNILGKEFGIGKKASIIPYGAFRAMYATRPKFSEKGLESLEIEGNDAWSVKPRAGVEIKGALPLGAASGWQLKGALNTAYEYELADLNERERARLTVIESKYHNLSKPQEEKGTFRTSASLGLEVEDRYGIFLTGEYSTGNSKENDYRTGVILKAVF
ncbi:transporter [Sebaldella sp. S0638]|uniref:transporter n=1 Tax=Sebaldella sp. S0638 TaxID=2957809 RepID=UPI0020A178F1|nr:transporter [Sebaldella sp. S0638]MCP1224249.1 transporter [Sebaldella sp. S0638]